MFPRYARSFGTLHHAYPMMPRVRAFMPPQGLLLIAATLPPGWEVRFVDENMAPATEEDFAWADAVFVSGMHVQRECIREVNERAHARGKVTVLGGPSVSAAPEWYPDFDILHIGELGDATGAVYARLEETTERPAAQIRYTTADRTPLSEFPAPAYGLIDIKHYFLASVQFSSGCPYRCEFCDIPELYGRNPRLKTPEQVCRELDAIFESGPPGCVYFVDDNFIANPKAAMDLLPHLVAWQRRTGYRLRFACEATLNIAQNRKLLELMREAYFHTVFIGIETPDAEALHGMVKDQNLRLPILEAVEILNSYGMEVVSGIILGLDQDTRETPDTILTFIEASKIPMLTINLLYALPRTPLWRRLEKERRILSDGAGGAESNVRFLLPRDVVRQSWLKCVTEANAPEPLYRRFQHQIEKTYPNRFKPGALLKVERSDVLNGVKILSRILWRVGVLSDYRRIFWRLAIPALKRLDIEAVIHAGLVGHHLIRFARDCEAGVGEYSFYAEGGAEVPAQSEDALLAVEAGAAPEPAVSESV
ncbi:MAG TPA: B12-binding domain-containing radical SAM protein [Thermoanaerobaculia bacterium]|nr:B12-binding domain-containing radical SAM protein [Thermoanaerobaculia bacterium]